VQHWLASDPPQGGASKKHRTPERRRLPVRRVWIERFLVEAKKIENEEHRQKCSRGPKKLLPAEPVRVKLGFAPLTPAKPWG